MPINRKENKKEVQKYDHIFNPKSRKSIDKTIADAEKSGELEKSYLANRGFLGIGAHSGAKWPHLFQYLKSLVGGKPTYVAYVPRDDHQDEARRMLAMGNPGRVISDEDVKDEHRVQAMHELAERANLILNNTGEKDRFLYAGTALGTLYGLAKVVRSKKVELPTDIIVPATIGGMSGKLIDTLRWLISDRQPDREASSLSYFNPLKGLYANHMDPSVIASESNTIAALGNPALLNARVAVRNMTGEMSPISKAMPGFGKVRTDANDPDLREKIKNEYEAYGNNSYIDKTINAIGTRSRGALGALMALARSAFNTI